MQNDEQEEEEEELSPTSPAVPARGPRLRLRFKQAVKDY